MAEVQHLHENIFALQQLAMPLSAGDPADEAYRILEKAKKASMRPTYAGEVAHESVKELSTRNFIAFCMVRTPPQTCAVFIDASPEQPTLYIAKSFLDKKDKALAGELRQYLESTAAAAAENQDVDEGSFSKFEIDFLEIIVRHCSAKIRQLCKAVTLAGLHDVYRQVLSPNAFSADDMADALLEEKKLGEERLGDKMLLELCELLAAGSGVNVGEGISTCLQVITTQIDEAMTSGQALTTVSSFCHCLGTSFIARRLLRKVINNGTLEEELFRSLIQLGRYARGAESLQKKLQESAFVELPRFRIIYAPRRVKKISWDTSPSEIFQEIYRDHRDKIRTKDELVISGLQWAQSSKFSMHVEVALVLYLRNNGMTGGKIGMSRPSCGICWSTIEALNDLYGETWNMAGNHGGRITITLPSGIEKVDKAVNLKIRNALALLVDAHIAASWAAGSTDPQPPSEKLSQAKLQDLLSNFAPSSEKSTYTNTSASSDAFGDMPNFRPASYARAVGPADIISNSKAHSIRHVTKDVTKETAKNTAKNAAKNAAKDNVVIVKALDTVEAVKEDERKPRSQTVEPLSKGKAKRYEYTKDKDGWTTVTYLRQKSSSPKRRFPGRRQMGQGVGGAATKKPAVIKA
ncbi:hypothetical protein BJ508DRAFT_320712 [Ascobolus immersus RN42]|uniref:Uncharacterized protein n=1 Tax=Ascobolus immersus RN42 TaxID=1160509 RepID=A0A3N4IQL5_ASCIM|nr:hypothetical protein BJ508DRAFT_320712 [Ascobolus immersus RN42]